MKGLSNQQHALQYPRIARTVDGWTVEYLAPVGNGQSVVNRYGLHGTKQEAAAYIRRVWGASA